MDRRTFLAAVPALVVANGARNQSHPDDKLTRLLAAARGQIGQTLAYDPNYTKIAYPNGDVPLSRGVCPDVIIRAYRAIGIDLQKLVHDDMAAHFGLYPRTWGLPAPDPSIDHRRVPNLRVFLARFGTVLPVSSDPTAFKPGDLITNLPGGHAHIAIVSDVVSPLSGRRMVYQNIGWGARLDDDLLTWEMTGHYRYVV